MPVKGPTAPTHLRAPGVPLCAVHPCHDGHPIQEKGGLGVQWPGLVDRHGERAWLTWEGRRSSARDPVEGQWHPPKSPPACPAQPDLQPLGLGGRRSHQALLAALGFPRSPQQGQMWPASPGKEGGGPGPRQASPLSSSAWKPLPRQQVPPLALRSLAPSKEKRQLLKGPPPAGRHVGQKSWSSEGHTHRPLTPGQPWLDGALVSSCSCCIHLDPHQPHVGTSSLIGMVCRPLDWLGLGYGHSTHPPGPWELHLTSSVQTLAQSRNPQGGL